MGRLKEMALGRLDYQRTMDTLRRSQMAYDSQEAPEYWWGCDEDWDTDKDDEPCEPDYQTEKERRLHDGDYLWEQERDRRLGY